MVCIVNSIQNYSGLRLRLSHHHQNWLISIMCITIKLFYICWSEMKYETYFCAHVFSICYQIDLCISWFWVLRKHFECTSYSLEFVPVLQKYLYVQVNIKNSSRAQILTWIICCNISRFDFNFLSQIHQWGGPDI